MSWRFEGLSIDELRSAIDFARLHGWDGGKGTPQRSAVRAQYEVWRQGTRGDVLEATYRWRWMARLDAWGHTQLGWFIYEVRDASTEQGGTDERTG